MRRQFLVARAVCTGGINLVGRLRFWEPEAARISGNPRELDQFLTEKSGNAENLRINLAPHAQISDRSALSFWAISADARPLQCSASTNPPESAC
ncbi:MAG: hypothetical protein AB3N23_21245 [Paracoccaceae bacterium]